MKPRDINIKDARVYTSDGESVEPVTAHQTLLQHIKLDKKEADDFPDLLEVLKGYTESTEFLIQFFEHPIISRKIVFVRRVAAAFPS